jgi:hypothetical protein
MDALQIIIVVLMQLVVDAHLPVLIAEHILTLAEITLIPQEHALAIVVTVRQHQTLVLEMHLIMPNAEILALLAQATNSAAMEHAIKTMDKANLKDIV